MSPRMWRHRITDIVEAIRKIATYVEDLDFEAFKGDERTIDAVIRNFIVIGEAARNIPEEVAEKYPAVPWRLMADMRNFAVHEYWGVELRTIWETIQEDLPPLGEALDQILADSSFSG
jgi:uncharacterized protein with HEPN domain